MRKFVKVLLWVVSCLLVVVTVLGFIAGNYFFNLALNPGYDKSTVLDNEQNVVDYDSMQQDFDEGEVWFEQSGYKGAVIESFDGLQLSAYMIENENPNGDWVIICHGYNSNAYTMVGFAKTFYDMGFNVLLPDARASGNSEGEYLGMGWLDRLDLVEWVNGLNRQYNPNNIALFGVSMGGATVMMASGEDLPENVRVIIEDSGYTSAWDEFSYQLKGLFGLPSFPLMQFSSAVTRIRAKYWLGDANAIRQLENCQTPTLFIHGEDDTFVPVAMLDELYNAMPGEKEKLIVPGAGHAGASFTAPQVYWNTVEAFIDKYFV